MNGRSNSKKRIGEASQSYFGYTLQLNRLFLVLLKAVPGDVAWLEKFDDVGRSSCHGTHYVEQDATYLSSNPLGDSSEKLFKTFANWITAVQQGWVNPATAEFKLFVLQSHSPGSIAAEITSACSTETAEACLLSIEKKHWGKSPRYSLRKKLSNKLAPHIDLILQNKSIAVEVIQKSRIECGDGDPTSAIEANLSSNPLEAARPARRIHFIQYMLGWLKIETERQLAANQIAHITFENFKDEISRYQRSHLQTNYLAPVARRPTDAQKNKLLNSSPNFVRQLEIIGFDQTDILSAINCFITARDDFNLWCGDCEVSQQDLETYTAELIRFWRLGKYDLSATLSDEEFGQKLAVKCFTSAYPLAGRDVEASFREGIYHDLADAPLEKLVVGWHRNFKKKLEEK